MNAKRTKAKAAALVVSEPAKEMPSEAAVREAMHLVWRNLPDGPTTFGECKCGRDIGRGGGPCLRCAEERLAAACGEREYASRYVQVVRVIRRLERQIFELVEANAASTKGEATR